MEYTSGSPDPTRAHLLRSAVPARDAGHRLADDIYAYVAGIDVVRADAGGFYVVEDKPARSLGRVVHAREPQDDDAPDLGALGAPRVLEHKPGTVIAAAYVIRDAGSGSIDRLSRRR
jgi:hypothetical protein